MGNLADNLAGIGLSRNRVKDTSRVLRLSFNVVLDIFLGVSWVFKGCFKDDLRKLQFVSKVPQRF